jgi:hypothetical protein
MKTEIAPAKEFDIADVVRRSPVANHPNAEADLRRFLRASFSAWTGSIDGEVACVWGLITPTVLSNRAYLWLLTTDLVDNHPFVFVRHSQMVLREMLGHFESIEGHVVAGQDRSIRWLKWLGFKMGRAERGMISFSRSA